MSSSRASTSRSAVTSTATPTATSGLPISAAAAARPVASRSATTTQAPCGQQPGDGAADAARGAGDQGDPAGVATAARAGAELGLLQRPVLHPELLALGDGVVGRDGLGAAHHVDGVDVELAGHAGRLLVLAEGEHARRPGRGRWPGRRRAWRAGVVGVAAVVGRVVLAVGGVQLARRADVRLERPRPPARRGRGAAPWCAGSGPGTTCPAGPGSSSFSPARNSSTTSRRGSARPSGGRSRPTARKRGARRGRLGSPLVGSQRRAVRHREPERLVDAVLVDVAPAPGR